MQRWKTVWKINSGTLVFSRCRIVQKFRRATKTHQFIHVMLQKTTWAGKVRKIHLWPKNVILQRCQIVKKFRIPVEIKEIV